MKRSLLRGALVATALLLAGPAGVRAGAGPGDRFPDVSLPTAGGGALALPGSPGRVLVVDFFASWCLVCRESLPAIDRLARELGPAVAVVAVGIDDDPDAGAAFLREIVPDPSFAVAVDRRGRFFARLGAPAMPSLYVVDPQGRIRDVIAGGGEKALARVRKAVADLVPAAPARAP